MSTPLTLLLTRPTRQCQTFADALEAAQPGRFTTVHAPLIEIVPIPGSLDLSDTQALLLTSANGVEQIAARTTDRSIPTLCVGEMTASAARDAGFTAQSADGDVSSLAALAREAYRPGQGAMLHIRGHHAAGSLTGMLKDAGIPVRAAEIYHQNPCVIEAGPARMLASGQIDIVTLFSPRTAQIFADTAREQNWNLATTRSVALSAAVDAALGNLTFVERRIAISPGREGMLDALAAL